MGELTLDEYIRRFSNCENFKNPHRHIKKARYKGAKVVLNEENRRLQTLQEEDKKNNTHKNRITFFTLSAPPSLKPIKTYCDIVGLPTNYKSPHNQIRYYDKECYEIVKNMPSGVDQQYLSLRGANVILK